MRERGLLKLGRLGASRWSAVTTFRVGTFSTGTMGNFQPELTLSYGLNRRVGSGAMVFAVGSDFFPLRTRGRLG
jgi:hypothetical protein